MLVLSRAALGLILGASAFLSAGLGMAADKVEPIYELRIYTCEPGKRPALDERFRDHTLKLLTKHGMKNLAYWYPDDPRDTENNKLVYLLEHASREAATASWKAFLDDPEWQQVAAASAEKHGKILAKPPEAIFLKKTDYSPAVGLPAAGQVYELRTYVAPEGRLDDLNTRFRDHTDRLFRKHGMISYGYWVPTDSPMSENTMIYVLQHPSRDAAAASFAEFGKDEEWIKARAESEKNGKLTAKKPDSVFLNLTDYSPHQ